MAEKNAPARIWATVNGMSTRLPDGARQFIGGWSQDPERPGVTEYVRADSHDKLVEALKAAEQQLDYGQVDAAHQIILRALSSLQTGETAE